ncbi:MAG: Gfo/Idh/MocA family oxidoreductase, partial [Clostridia bacterium]|nr:Gfo/Idh/MocA family oxidoreductase [Clostridia bacterium]
LNISPLYSTFLRSKVCFTGMFGISYLPHFETARRLVNSGVLGDIRLVTAQKSYKLRKRAPFYSSRELYGGTIPWVAIHAIDWIYSLCNVDFKSVLASHSTVGNHDNGMLESSSLMMFDCGMGISASVNADFFRPYGAPTHDDDRIRIAGTEGVLEVMGGKVSLITPDTNFTNIPLVNPSHELFEEFCMEICGEGKCRVTAKETFDVTRIALIARESADLSKQMEIKL